MSLLATLEGQEAEEEAKRKAIHERVSMVEAALRNMESKLTGLAGSIARLIARAVGTATLVRTKQELADDKAIRDDFNRRKRRLAKDSSIPDGAPDLSAVQKALKRLEDKGIIERSVIVSETSMKCEGRTIAEHESYHPRANDRLFCRNQISVRDFKAANDLFPGGLRGGKTRGKKGERPGERRGKKGGKTGENRRAIRNNSYPLPFIPTTTIPLGTKRRSHQRRLLLWGMKNELVKAAWDKLLRSTPSHRRLESCERLWELAWLAEVLGERDLIEDYTYSVKNNKIESYPRYIAGILRKACEGHRKTWNADFRPQCPPMPPMPAQSESVSTQRQTESRNDFEKRFRGWWKAERIKRNGGPLTEEDLLEESKAAEAAWLSYKSRIDNGVMQHDRPNPRSVSIPIELEKLADLIAERVPKASSRPKQKFVSAKELATTTGLGERTIARWKAAGKLPFQTAGVAFCFRSMIR